MFTCKIHQIYNTFTGVRNSFPLNILKETGIQQNFAYTVILIRNRFGLL